ncbi:hypothetical protein [Salinibius halmophilus]|uniref:hypothetical protein n=1 Tax=Salinibius halmophilus TaxID=1853216 RepID=UPI000E672ECB|nr:hypothetical protein [Salinibius halmophilus]
MKALTSLAVLTSMAISATTLAATVDNVQPMLTMVPTPPIYTPDCSYSDPEPTVKRISHDVSFNGYFADLQLMFMPPMAGEYLDVQIIDADGAVYASGNYLMVEYGTTSFTAEAIYTRSPPVGCSTWPVVKKEIQHITLTSDSYPEPEFLLGVTQPVNGLTYQYNDACWQAQNSPTAWEPVLAGWFWQPVECRVIEPICKPMPIPTPKPDLPTLLVNDYRGGEYDITSYVESLAAYAGTSVAKVIVQPANEHQQVVKRDGRTYLVGHGRAQLSAKLFYPHPDMGCPGTNYAIAGAVDLVAPVCLDVDKPKPYKRVDTITIAQGDTLDARELLLMSYGAPVVFEPELLYNLQVKTIAGDITVTGTGADYQISGSGKVRVTGEYDLDLGGPQCGSYHVTGGSLDLTIITEPTPTPVVSLIPTPTQACIPLAPAKPRQVVDEVVLAAGESVSLKQQLMRAYHTPGASPLTPEFIVNGAVMTYDGEISLVDTPDDDLRFTGEGRVRMVGTYELHTGEGCSVFSKNTGSVELTITQE